MLKEIQGYLEVPNSEALKLSLADVHYKGIFSLVIEGAEHGRLTRVFIADTKLRPYQVQLHTHRYPIKLLVLAGNVRQHTAFIQEGPCIGAAQMSLYNYRSPLNGGNGLSYGREVRVMLNDFHLPIGSMVKMNTNEFHTMSVSNGSVWVVQEGGFQTDESQVLGVPFITEGLYNAPYQYQVNDKVQLVKIVLKNLLKQYHSL